MIDLEMLYEPHVLGIILCPNFLFLFFKIKFIYLFLNETKMSILMMKKKVKWTRLSCVQLFVTPWTIQSMEFSRAEYFPFFRGSSQTRDRTQVSHTAGRFFYQLSHKGSPLIFLLIFALCILDDTYVYLMIHKAKIRRNIKEKNNI